MINITEERFNLIDLSIIIVHTSTFTFTQPCASDSSSTAFTVSCARPFAAAVQEDGASFTGILECCPVCDDPLAVRGASNVVAD